MKTNERKTTESRVCFVDDNNSNNNNRDDKKNEKKNRVKKIRILTVYYLINLNPVNKFIKYVIAESQNDMCVYICPNHAVFIPIGFPISLFLLQSIVSIRS